MNGKKIKKQNVEKLLKYIENKDHAVSDKKSGNNATKKTG